MCIMRREYYLRAVVVAVVIGIFLSAFAGNVWAGEIAKLSIKPPDTEAHGVYPEEVRLVSVDFIGWFCYGKKENGPRRIMKIANSGTIDERKKLAGRIYYNQDKEGHLFWFNLGYGTFHYRAELIVPGSKSFDECYTFADLEEMKRKAIDWARATRKGLPWRKKLPWE